MNAEKPQKLQLDISFMQAHRAISEDPEKIWEDDALGRKEFAQNLTFFAKNSQTPFVLALHGKWGCGKTFMLRRWQKELEKNQGAKVIYFNAWEDDFCGDPFVAIIGQLKAVLEENDSDWKKIKESAKSLIPWLERKVLAVASIEQKDLQSVSEQVFDEYVETKKNLRALRKCLAEMAKKIKEKTGMPLVFIIDELDRCRPTFAIETLERIKHIFDIENIFFVLGLNKTQLEKSIKSCYGDIDGEGYLGRFFDHDKEMSAIPSMYYNYIFNKMEISPFFNQSRVHTIQYNRDAYPGWRTALDEDREVYSAIADCMHLSLREVKKFARMMINILNEKENHDPVVYDAEGWAAIFLAFLRIKYPRSYQDFVEGEIKSKDIINKMLKSFPQDEGDDSDSRSPDLSECQNMIEGVFYLLSDKKDLHSVKMELTALVQQENKELKLLSERTKRIGSSHADMILNRFVNANRAFDGIPLQKIARMVDIGVHK